MLAIEHPVHGAVLNGRHGDITNDGLTIRVEGRAEIGDGVIVNDLPETFRCIP